MAEIDDADCLGDFGLWKDDNAPAAFDCESSEDFCSEYDSDTPVLDERRLSSCALFDVLGTEDTWQGKLFFPVYLNNRSRGMLILMRWPMVAILQRLGLRELIMLASTCRSMRKSAARVLEEHAQLLLHKRYFQNTNLIKFLDAFACFGWAMSLTEFMTPATLRSWSVEELDAIFEHLIACVDMEAVSLLQGLQPAAFQRWRVEGRKALANFITDCVVQKPSFYKMLRHYDIAWKAVSLIMEENARLVLKAMFDGSTFVLRRMQASWPEVTVCADVSRASKHQFPEDMSLWTASEVQQWFRLKKLPVRGVIDMQPTGADLLDWVALESARSKYSYFLQAPPRGLGLTFQQRNRCMLLVERQSNRSLQCAPLGKTYAHTFTFRFGEPKNAHAGTAAASAERARTKGSVAAALSVDSTPCRSWSSE